MSATKVYKCDICREKLKDNTRCYGLNFSNLVIFTVSTYLSTDGIHICYGCARQLKDQLGTITIPEEGGTPDAKE